MDSHPRPTKTQQTENLISKATVREAFEQHGLILLGIVDLENATAYARYVNWLENGRHAGLTYMQENQEVRKNPQLILDSAANLIVFAQTYPYTGPTKVKPGFGRIASYALHKDYHRVMQRKAATAVQYLYATAPLLSNHKYRVGVDTLPLLERSYAAKTGKGFIGKNTCYIRPGLGSFLLLGEVLTNWPLAIDRPATIDPYARTSEGGCGTCKRCQIKCPTGALDFDYQLDAKKCISYWTIEHRGTIPIDFWPNLKDYIFGCDICQAVCPYNRPLKSAAKPTVKIQEEVDLFHLATLSQRDYETMFGGTPVTRAKRTGLRRNALIALFVNKDSRLREAISCCSAENNPVLSETIQQIRSQTQSL